MSKGLNRPENAVMRTAEIQKKLAEVFSLALKCNEFADVMIHYWGHTDSMKIYFYRDGWRKDADPEWDAEIDRFAVEDTNGEVIDLVISKLMKEVKAHDAF